MNQLLKNNMRKKKVSSVDKEKQEIYFISTLIIQNYFVLSETSIKKNYPIHSSYFITKYKQDKVT